MVKIVSSDDCGSSAFLVTVFARIVHGLCRSIRCCWTKIGAFHRHLSLSVKVLARPLSQTLSVSSRIVRIGVARRLCSSSFFICALFVCSLYGNDTLASAFGWWGNLRSEVILCRQGQVMWPLCLVALAHASNCQPSRRPAAAYCPTFIWRRHYRYRYHCFSPSGTSVRQFCMSSSLESSLDRSLRPRMLFISLTEAMDSFFFRGGSFFFF